MAGLHLSVGDKQDIQRVLEKLQEVDPRVAQQFLEDYPRGNRSVIGRFFSGAYHQPITWWIGIFQLQMQMGAWGHRWKMVADMRANRLWWVTKPVRDEINGTAAGEDAPILTAIAKYFGQHKKAEILGRFAGAQFTTYATTGGRLGRKRVSTGNKIAVAVTNFTIASYGAAIKAIVSEYQTLESVIHAILTGQPANLVIDHARENAAPLTDKEAELLDKLEATLSELMPLTQRSGPGVPIQEFCARPENLNLSGLCR